jgi:hypothetical protein
MIGLFLSPESKVIAAQAPEITATGGSGFESFALLRLPRWVLSFEKWCLHGAPYSGQPEALMLSSLNGYAFWLSPKVRDPRPA